MSTWKGWRWTTVLGGVWEWMLRRTEVGTHYRRHGGTEGYKGSTSDLKGWVEIVLEIIQSRKLQSGDPNWLKLAWTKAINYYLGRKYWKVSVIFVEATVLLWYCRKNIIVLMRRVWNQWYMMSSCLSIYKWYVIDEILKFLITVLFQSIEERNHFSFEEVFLRTHLQSVLCTAQEQKP